MFWMAISTPHCSVQNNKKPSQCLSDSYFYDEPVTELRSTKICALVQYAITMLQGGIVHIVGSTRAFYVTDLASTLSLPTTFAGQTRLVSKYGQGLQCHTSGPSLVERIQQRGVGFWGKLLLLFLLPACAAAQASGTSTDLIRDKTKRPRQRKSQTRKLPPLMMALLPQLTGNHVQAHG